MYVGPSVQTNNDKQGKGNIHTFLWLCNHYGCAITMVYIRVYIYIYMYIYIYTQQNLEQDAIISLASLADARHSAISCHTFLHPHLNFNTISCFSFMSTSLTQLNTLFNAFFSLHTYICSTYIYQLKEPSCPEYLGPVAMLPNSQGCGMCSLWHCATCSNES